MREPTDDIADAGRPSSGTHRAVRTDGLSTASAAATSFRDRTAWARNLASPLRDFLSNETGGAVALLAATVAALLWANSPWSGSYESLWSTELAIRVGDSAISLDLRHWVNEGLMTFFFLVVGLEAKRELDMGELRERRRLTIPVAAAAGGLLVPGAHLPGLQRGWRRRARVGGGDVDRHGVRARHAGGWRPPAAPACASPCCRSPSSTTSWRWW